MSTSEERETIEIPKEKLDEFSDEVHRELVEEGGLEEKAAREYAESFHLEEIETSDPVKKNVLPGLKDRFSLLRGKYTHLQNITWRKTHCATVQRVKPEEENIRLQIDYPTKQRGNIFLDSTSSKLANLKEYAGVTSLKELEGIRLPVKNIGTFQENSPWTEKVYIPNNVSISGQVRFKLFSALRGFRRKITIGESLDEAHIVSCLATLFILFPLTSITSLLPTLGLPLLKEGATLFTLIYILISLPFLILSIFTCATLMYAFSHITLGVADFVLKGNFYEE